MRQQIAIRVDAAFLMGELQPRYPELVDRKFQVWGQMALDPYETLAGVEFGQELSGVETRQYGKEFARRVCGIDDLPRIGVKRGAVQCRRQQLAFAVDNVGAAGWGRRRRVEASNRGYGDGARQQRNLDEPPGDDRKDHDE